jgi:hypothetical protein
MQLPAMVNTTGQDDSFLPINVTLILASHYKLLSFLNSRLTATGRIQSVTCDSCLIRLTRESCLEIAIIFIRTPLGITANAISAGSDVVHPAGPRQSQVGG